MMIIMINDEKTTQMKGSGQQQDTGWLHTLKPLRP